MSAAASATAQYSAGVELTLRRLRSPGDGVDVGAAVQPAPRRAHIAAPAPGAGARVSLVRTARRRPPRCGDGAAAASASGATTERRPKTEPRCGRTGIGARAARGALRSGEAR